MARQLRLTAARNLLTRAPARPTALERMTQRRPIAPDDGFVPLPQPAGPPPYHLQLDDVLPAAARAHIDRDHALRFHCVGDTGGHTDPRPQRRVVSAMAAELTGPQSARFFYHLGDVVYPHGEEANYRPQFFSAYAGYRAPIFAVPGNHDGESPGVSLGGFVKTFISGSPPLHDASADAARPLARQPHVYWTLVHDWFRIIGLYSNVPEGGQFDDEQLCWLTEELRSVPAGVTVMIAVHQPVYGADVTHGANLALADALDACSARAGRAPDAVFCGHAHSYQRFARRTATRDASTPYIVAGAGGYPELHPLAAGVHELPASFPGVPDVTLAACEDRRHGFMTVTARPGGADVVYTAVGERGGERVDAFRIVAATSRRAPRSR